MAKKEHSRAIGFIINDDDWEEFLGDSSAEEVKDMLGACIAYHKYKVLTQFTDRMLKKFFRDMVRCMNYSDDSYYETCMKNAYNRYVGTCKSKGKEILDRDEWFETVYLPKHPLPSDVCDGRQLPSADVTNINRIEEKIQDKIRILEETEIKNETESEEKTEMEIGDRGVQGGKREEPFRLPLTQAVGGAFPNNAGTPKNYTVAVSKDAEPVLQDYLRACAAGNQKEAVHLRCRLIDDYGCDPEKLNAKG